MKFRANQESAVQTTRTRWAGWYWMLLMILSLVSVASASAKDIYIAQNAAGAADGSSCANAKVYTFFNSSSNWGSGSTQIGPGTTVHLCGTFTGTANSRELTVQGSGASGNPITILFEPGAIMQSPVWDAAIYISGFNYITVDGGTNGLIQNTANGSGLTYQNGSSAVSSFGVSHVIYQNLTVKNIYQRTSKNDVANGITATSGLDFSNGASNVSITHSSISNAYAGIYYQPQTGDTNISITNNTIRDFNWGIAGADPGGSKISNFTITGNDIACTVGANCNFDDPSDDYHHNGIIIYPQDATTMTNVIIANNWIHDVIGNTTGYIFLDPSGSGDMPGVQIYNNVLTSSGGLYGPLNAYITVGIGVSGARVYNNTVSGAGSQGISGQKSPDFRNNIVSGPQYGEWLNAPYSGVTSNYNDFYNLQYGMAANDGSNTYGNVASWKSATGFDANTIITNPNLNSSFMLNSGSPAVEVGTNLTGLGIAGLNVGAPQFFGVNYACGIGCVPRPTSGAWDIGAYQFSSSTGSQPNPPTNLSAIVQ